jgi:hypothetical protein
MRIALRRISVTLEEAVKMFYEVQSREKTIEEMKHKKIGESVYNLEGSKRNTKQLINRHEHGLS